MIGGQNLENIVPIKHVVDIGGNVPTLDSNDYVNVGDLVIDKNTANGNRVIVWRCHRNTPGRTYYNLKTEISEELDY